MVIHSRRPARRRTPGAILPEILQKRFHRKAEAGDNRGDKKGNGKQKPIIQNFNFQ